PGAASRVRLTAGDVARYAPRLKQTAAPRIRWEPPSCSWSAQSERRPQEYFPILGERLSVLGLSLAKPSGANDEASADHGESCPFILPQLRGANGERTDDQRIGQDQSVVACS